MCFCWNCGIQIQDTASHPISEIDEVLRRAIERIHNNSRGVHIDTNQEKALSLLRKRGSIGVRRAELFAITHAHTDKSVGVLIVRIRDRIEDEGKILVSESRLAVR